VKWKTTNCHAPQFRLCHRDRFKISIRWPDIYRSIHRRGLSQIRHPISVSLFSCVAIESTSVPRLWIPGFDKNIPAVGSSQKIVGSFNSGCGKSDHILQ
jgi:hypothetical protein